MKDLKELVEANKAKRYMTDEERVKQIVDNYQIFLDCHVSVQKIQATYNLPRDHASVLLVKVNIARGKL